MSFFKYKARCISEFKAIRNFSVMVSIGGVLFISSISMLELMIEKNSFYIMSKFIFYITIIAVIMTIVISCIKKTVYVGYYIFLQSSMIIGLLNLYLLGMKCILFSDKLLRMIVLFNPIILTIFMIIYSICRLAIKLPKDSKYVKNIRLKSLAIPIIVAILENVALIFTIKLNFSKEVILVLKDIPVFLSCIFLSMFSISGMIISGYKLARYINVFCNK